MLTEEQKRGERVQGKKKKEELTPEEYRQQARDEISEVKAEWKVFLRTGIIMFAALVAIIIACIAWFVSNNKVTISGTKVQSAGSEFELAAAAKPDSESSTGAYDNLLDVQPGTETSIGSQKFLATDGSHTSITWAITDDSNMNNNNPEDGIEPGASGQMTFYIISQKDGPLSVTLDLTLTGYTGEETAETLSDLQKANEKAQQLLKGHVLLFAGYDSAANSYKGWISEDADPWSMTLDYERERGVLSRAENGKLTWSVQNAEKGTAYPVTIYWVWPEMLGSYLVKDQSSIGKRPILFPEDWNESSNHLTELPKALFTTMCKTDDKDNNRYFYWKESEDFNFKGTVTEKKLNQMRTNFNPVMYGTLAVYYNQADEYLGSNVRFVKLKLDAQ